MLSEIEHSLELEDSLMMSKTNCGPERLIIKQVQPANRYTF